MQNGSGAQRTIIANTDILVVDGTNIGGATVATGTALIHLNSATTAQLKLINGASVNLVRVASSNGTLTIANNTVGEAGLIIDATSTLQLNNNAYVGNIYIDFPTSTGSIAGTVRLIQGGSTVASSSPRLTSRTLGAVVFLAGSTLSYDNTLSYPFGTIGVNASNSANGSFIFESGSTLIHKGPFNPFGNSSTATLINLKSGSNFVLEAANVANMFNNKSLGNVIVRNNTNVTLTENFSNIENLTVEAGSAFYIRTTSVSPISGNILNNGIFGAAAGVTTSQLLLSGTTPQTISGSGTFADLGAISIGTDASVTLSRSLNLVGSSTSSVAGTLNLGTQVLTGSGGFVARGKYANVITGATVNSGSAVITLPVASYGSAGVALGVLVQGAGIPANSYIVGTNSGASQFTISNVATANGTEVTLSSNTHLITSNGAGIDGSITLAGSKSYGSGTNYTFNAATITPFTTNSSNALGDVTFNAAATTNKGITIDGKLTLNNAKLTIREGDEVTMATTGSFGGTFNSSAYMATTANATTGAVGTLKVSGLTATTLIPVGTTGNYSPVTLTPTTASDFEINVFAGATANATPNGTALTAAQKLRMVDAVWSINRTAGTGNVDVTLGWENALEGADFSAFTNAQIGVAAYNGSSFGMFTGTGNAAANTATLTTSVFSPFVVGEANTTLPLTLISFTAKESLNSVKLAWQTTDEVNLKNYVLQHRKGNSFEDIYTVAANNRAGIFNYSYTHLNPTAGTNYYRLVGVDFDGSKQTSNPIPVIVTLGNEVTVYPNPVTQKNISVSGAIKGDVIRILNIQGQVMATKAASGNQVEEIEVQNFQAGTYILSIENAGKVTATKKLIKI
ncbi:beta strand repeat-containing protein [Pedobacter sp. SL55]|uniref:beta strand repeat-containing protein n=1 Tax=Pedobacter sp. SL55 TaxID=2995161 RepID=UPI00226DB02A|nr:T9SS type A sorting domain-containing protein [Pedobacter sp. SL55]WAC40547.1 T9SS type A sorting domain-containing protein [Pedobacter sp. SL55]